MKIRSHTVLIVSLLAIIALIPIKGLAEVSTPSPEISLEPLTFNYSLAIDGTHANGPSKRHSSLQRPNVSAHTLRIFPKRLNTQTSSMEKHQVEAEPAQAFSIVADEQVPSYIIHEPVVLHHEVTLQKVINPTSLPSGEQQTENQTFHDSQKKTPHTPVRQTAVRIFQRDRFPSFSRFDWPLIEYEQQQKFSNVSTEVSLRDAEIRVSEHSKSNTYLARFVDVLKSEWEPVDPETFSVYGTIPLVINDAVDKNLRYFQKGITDRFQSYLDRFHHYKEIVEPIFMEFGIPTELMYLSLVESGFNPKAFSRARASGPWQFMKATGRMYKLNVTWYVDERRDPIKSTVAAAHHLRDLYDRFGSWPLALAAYNAGSGKVSRAIRKTGSRDFWKIRRTWYLRRETKDYVPRFIAATLIAKNPTAYGFLPPEGDRHQFEEVLFSKPVQLAAISKQTGVSLKELKRLNPELRRNIVPRSKGPGYHLKVPVGMASLVAANQTRFPVWTQPPPPPTQWYRVRRGDSLSVVARRFRMKVRQLKDMNNLSSNLIRVGARLRVRGGDEDYADDQIIWYRVRYGDSLGKIAGRFGTSVRQIKKLNKLSTHLIFPGDRLRVKGSPSPKKSSTKDSKWYRVQRGDSLWSIAQQFRVSVRDLRTLNNLSSSIIRAGHMLVVSH